MVHGSGHVSLSSSDPSRCAYYNPAMPARVVRPRRPLSWFAERLTERLLFEPRRAEAAFVRRLRADMPALEGGSAADAASLWDHLRAEIRRLVRTKDPERFLQWPPVRASIVRRSRARVAAELRHLRGRADWAARWRPALREMTLGAPRPFSLMPSSSGTLIHQAYHLCRFEEATGRPVDRERLVVEFGGGYGAMCWVMHRLGFRGTYVIVDLPEVSALQRFYLRHTGLEVVDADNGLPAHGVVTTSDLGRLTSLLGERPPGAAAFLAAWALSESPVSLRDRVRASVADFDDFLIGYTERCLDVDNRAYFADWRARLPDRRWYDVPVPQLREADWHLFGTRDAGAV